MPGGDCKRQRHSTSVAPRSAARSTSIVRRSTIQRLVRGRANPVEVLHQSRTVHAGLGRCRNRPNRAVLLLGGCFGKLFPEDHVVDDQGKHQGVMVLVVLRRVAEHLHPGRREKLVGRSHGDVGVAISQHRPVAIEDRERGLILGNPQVGRADGFAPMLRAEKSGADKQRKRYR